MSDEPKPELHWETIDGSGTIQRTKILGGWLVRLDDRSNWGIAAGLAFVPDPRHEWDGKSLP